MYVQLVDLIFASNIGIYRVDYVYVQLVNFIFLSRVAI